MILPDKYVPYEKSIVYYSDLVLGIIMNMKEPKTIEIIWNRFKKVHKSISFSDFYNSVFHKGTFFAFVKTSWFTLQGSSDCWGILKRRRLRERPPPSHMQPAAMEYDYETSSDSGHRPFAFLVRNKRASRGIQKNDHPCRHGQPSGFAPRHRA